MEKQPRHNCSKERLTYTIKKKKLRTISIVTKYSSLTVLLAAVIKLQHCVT